MVFKIYTVAGGGSAAWTESWTNAALWTETGATTITNGTGGNGCSTDAKKIVYTTQTNESSLKADNIFGTRPSRKAPSSKRFPPVPIMFASSIRFPPGTTATISRTALMSKTEFSACLSGRSLRKRLIFPPGIIISVSRSRATAEMVPRKRLTSVPQAINANNLVGDGYIGLANTSPAQDAANINYNPASGTNNALSVTYGSGGAPGRRSR